MSDRPASHPTNASAKIELTGDFYVGLSVYSHNTARLETVTFSDVAPIQPKPDPSAST